MADNTVTLLSVTYGKDSPFTLPVPTSFLTLPSPTPKVIIDLGAPSPTHEADERCNCGSMCLFMEGETSTNCYSCGDILRR